MICKLQKHLWVHQKNVTKYKMDIDNLIDGFSGCNTMSGNEQYLNLLDMISELSEMIYIQKKVNNVLIDKVKSFISLYIRCIVFPVEMKQNLLNAKYELDSGNYEEGSILCYKVFCDIKNELN